MIRQILTIPNDILNTPCLETKSTTSLRKDLKDTLGQLENAIGLAAPQIGESVRAFALRDENGVVTVYTNPKITKASITVETDIEGCLSMPLEYYQVSRSTEIEFEHDKGKMSASGYEARCIQHEINHLDGILISDIGERIVPFSSRQTDNSS